MRSADVKTRIRLPRLELLIRGACIDDDAMFSGEHCIIIDTRATDEQQVGRNGGLKTLMRLADCGLYINIKTPSVNINTHLVIQHLLEEVHQSGP